NAGFVNRYVPAVLADSKVPGRVYAGVLFDKLNGGLFISEDGGITWQQSMNGMGVRDIYSLTQSPTHPETIYAGTNHGVFRSDDQGRNWAQVKREEPSEDDLEKSEKAGEMNKNSTGKTPNNKSGKTKAATGQPSITTPPAQTTPASPVSTRPRVVPSENQA